MKLKNIYAVIAAAALSAIAASCGSNYDPKEIAKIDEADELTAEQTETALGWYEDALQRDIQKVEEEKGKIRQEMLEERAARIGKRAARSGSNETDYANAMVYKSHKEKIEKLEEDLQKARERLYEEIDKAREELDW